MESKCLLELIVTTDADGYINTKYGYTVNHEGFSEKFNKDTLGCWFIVGRNTFESMTKRRHRHYIVLSKDENYRPFTDGTYEVRVVNSREAAMAILNRIGIIRAFVIGGKQIFDLFADYEYTDRIVICKVSHKIADGLYKFEVKNKKKFNVFFDQMTGYKKITMVKKHDPSKKAKSMNKQVFIPRK